MDASTDLIDAVRTATEPVGSSSGRSRSIARDVNVYYGAKQALVRSSTSTSPSGQVTALIGPSGCGKSTFLRCLNRMNDTIDGCARRRRDQARRPGHLRRRHRRGAAARPRRHGVPEAQPVPEVDLRECRLRPAHPRACRGKAELDEIVETSLQQAGLWDEVKDRLDAAGHRPVRRPAAAPVHRPRHRGQPRGDPDGRAVLGARPDRHRARSRS